MTALPANRFSAWKQFWVLWRFQAVLNRYIWRVPMYMAVLFFTDIFGLQIDTPFLFTSVTLNFCIVFLPSLLLLSRPSNSSRRSLFAPAPVVADSPRSSHVWSALSGEFLLTRAVDRRLFHRSLTVLFYPLVLVVPLALLFASARHPDLRVEFPSRTSPAQCLAQFPGSTLLPIKTGNDWPVVNLPNGKIIVAEWHLWALLAAMPGIQLLYLVDAFRKTWWFRSVGNFVRNLALLLVELFLAAGLIALLDNQRLFFSFITHQTTFWLMTVPLVILAQFICERLFERVEQ